MRATVRRALAGVCVLVVATGAAAAPAHAATGPDRHLLLELAPTDAAALDALAAATGLDTATRRARLRGLTPTAAGRARLLGQLQSLGVLADGDGTAWTVPLVGPAAVLDRLFPPDGTAGVRAVPSWLPSVVRVEDRDAPVVQHRLGRVAVLPSVARAATPTDGCNGRASSSTSTFAGYVGLDITTQYQAPAPSCSLWAGDTSTPIIATIQFSGWTSGDLVQEARDQTGNGSVDPVASGQVVSVGVDRATGYDKAKDGEGDSEVALDVQAILRTAPMLRQRVYVVSQASGGEAAVYGRILSDIQSGLDITTVSTSWGYCEQKRDGSYYQPGQLPETAIKALVAAGVTMFAASGDGGAYDCGGSQELVDYPSSSPSVVGVGGTTWPVSGDRTERAWSTGRTAGTSAGTGGGYSHVFATPSWQQRVNSTGRRAVPDLSVLGNPATGMKSYTQRTGGYGRVGGTSLSAPALAGMFASEMVSRGRTSGFGDVHPTLYALPSSAFTDVTTGNNVGYDAAPGYDVASGLGTPHVLAIGQALVPPTAGALTTSAGVNQRVAAAQPFPTALAARVVSTTGSAAGEGVPGVAVTFTASSGVTFPDGATATTVTTDATGTATAPTLTAGTTAGGYAVTATAGSFSATFGETVVAGPAATLLAAAGADQTAKPGAGYPTAPAVTAADAYGNPVPGLAVQFAVPSSAAAGTFSGGATSAAASSDAAGLATAPGLTAKQAVGAWTVTASAGSLSAVLNLTTSTAAAVTVVAGSGQTTRAGAAFGVPLQARAVDADGRPVAGVVVTFTLPAVAGFNAGGTVAKVTTGSDGLATAGVAVGTRQGDGSAVASLSSTLTTTYALTVKRAFARIAPQPARLGHSGGLPHAVVGAAVAPRAGRRSGALVD